jgi:hypothetical protein
MPIEQLKKIADRAHASDENADRAAEGDCQSGQYFGGMPMVYDRP